MLLAVTALIELFVVAFASAGFGEVADASPFGRVGTQIAAIVTASARTISIGPIASKAARNGTTNGAEAGMNVATVATTPDGSLITAKIATK